VNQKHYAVVIGFDNYIDEAIPNLKGAAYDATQFRKWLISTDKRGGRLPPENVVSLIDGVSPNLGYISMKNQLSQIIRGNNENELRDRLYIYMAGHGLTLEENSYLEKDRTAFLPIDTPSEDFNPHFWIYNMITYISRNGNYKEIIIVMDCCRDVMDTAEVTKAFTSRLVSDKLEDTNYPHIHTIYATLPKLKTREEEIKKNVYAGVFTGAVLRALRGGVDANENITLDSIEDHVLNDYSTKNQSSPKFSDTQQNNPVFSVEGESSKGAIELRYSDYDGTFAYLKIINPKHQGSVILTQTYPSAINLEDLSPGKYTLKLFSSDDELIESISISLAAEETREISFSLEASNA
jgi:hypothetical protein